MREAGERAIKHVKIALRYSRLNQYSTYNDKV